MEKRSPIWKYFIVCGDDESKALCTICEMVISRGGRSKKSFTTSPLNNHLSYKHPEEFKLVISQRESAQNDRTMVESKSPGSSLPSQTEKTCKRKKLWPIDSAEAYKIHIAICKMIAIDIQPLSIIEDTGFRSLIGLLEPRYDMPDRQYLLEQVFPQMYDALKIQVQLQVDQVKLITLSIDKWTQHNSSEDIIVITVHWIDNSFERKSALLHCQRIIEKNSELHIVEAMTDILDEWKINNQKVHAVLCDTCPDIAKDMHEMNLTNVICFSQTLHQVIHDAVLCQPSFVEILKSLCKIVDHFEQSSSAVVRLREICQELELPVIEVPINKLCIDVGDCWNSTFHMLGQLLDQKQAILFYCLEVCGLDGQDINLTSDQWNLISSIVTLLRPFDQLFHEIRTTNACLSMILPAMQAILLYLQGMCGDDTNKMAEEIIKAVRLKFLQLLENKLLVISAGLDPRFKLNFLAEAQKINAKTEILMAASLSQSHGFSPDKQSPEDPPKPLAKQARITHDDFWTSWDLMQTSICQPQRSTSADTEKQLNMFLNEACISRDLDPVTWWQINADRFPALQSCAQHFLAAPAASVQSKHLFISGGRTLTEQRSHLLAENLEKLVFLKANASFMQI